MKQRDLGSIFGTWRQKSYDTAAIAYRCGHDDLVLYMLCAPAILP